MQASQGVREEKQATVTQNRSERSMCFFVWEGVIKTQTSDQGLNEVDVPVHLYRARTISKDS